MAERRENSVLFSLKELRRIEDDRVKREQDEVRARADAERAAKEAAERAVRDAEDRRLRDEEDRVRRIEDEKEAKLREEQLRLQEAERRARIEGEMRLQEERMRLEVQARAHSKSPIKAVLGVAAVLILGAGVLGWKMYTQHQAELTAERVNAARAAEAATKAAQIEFEKRIAAIQNEMNDKLASARTEEERSRIRADAERAQAQARAVATNRSHRSTGKGEKGDSAGGTSSGRGKVVKKDVSDNPLDGL
jgi:hypothetical protein